MVHFPLSGVDTYFWLPTAVAIAVSFFSSTGGLSGAFLLLPFQVSVLGYVGPGVSATNLLFNVVAIPGGVYRYWREKRMVWPLALIIVLGTVPGIFIGASLRVKFLPDPRNFKLFVGLVLLYIGGRLAADLFKRKGGAAADKNSTRSNFQVSNPRLGWKRISYQFEGNLYSVSSWSFIAFCTLVGIIGGAYGIGGGAIIAPFLVAVYRLPVHTIAGSALFGTFSSSVAGVLIYFLINQFQPATTASTSPDWLLGILFGLGGFIGIYLGARAQRFLPEKLIKLILTILLLFVSGNYIINYFL